MASDDVIDRLIAWGAGRDDLRAMLLTSTRAVPGAAVDQLSDYDVILVLTDIRPLHADRRWLADFGRPLVSYWDGVQLDPEFGVESSGNVIQFAGGLKIDFSLWPVELLERIAAAPSLPAELDAGYRVLLDKDGLAAALAAPSYRAYRPTPPSAAEFAVFVEDFFSDVPYVAKCLWRGDLLPAKWCLDFDMRYPFLIRLLEWRVGLDHGWDTPVGNNGKGLRRRLPPDVWAELVASYAGGTLESNWESLFRTAALFRRVAVDAAARMGLAYPLEMDREVMGYAAHLRALPGAATDEAS